jgi:invasin B
MAGSMRIERSGFVDSAPMNEVAFNKTRVAPDVAAGVQKATQAILNTVFRVDGQNIEMLPGNDLAKPLLTPARAAPVKGIYAANQLLAELGLILGEAALSELTGQIELFKSLSEARKKSLESASEEFTTATDQAEGAVKQFDVAHARTVAAQTAFNAAKGGVKQAQIDVAQAKFDLTLAQGNADVDAAAAAAEADAGEAKPALPTPPDKANLVLVETRLKQARQVFLAAGKKLKEATEKELPLYAEAKQKTGVAIDMETRALQLAGSTLDNRSEVQRLAGSTARLTLLIASLTQTISEGNEASLKNDQDLFKSMQLERQKTLEKAASDYDAQVQKAEQVGKTMGCIGKIVGGILTAVSLLAIPFTGGASAALAVIGVGMMVADAITTAVTGGTSLTSMAMAPIMANVIQPLIKELGKMIANALEIAGVPKEEAERTGNIIAMVAVAVAMLVLMIGISLVAKNSAVLNKFTTAVGKTLSKGINKAINKAMAKGLPKSFASSMDKVTGSMTKAAPDVTRNLSNLPKELAAKEMQFGLSMAQTGLGAAKGAIDGSGQIAVGIFAGRAADFDAEMAVATNDLEHMRQLLSDAADRFVEMLESVSQLNVAASDATRQVMETSAFVLKHARA